MTGCMREGACLPASAASAAAASTAAAAQDLRRAPLPQFAGSLNALPVASTAVREQVNPQCGWLGAEFWTKGTTGSYTAAMKYTGDETNLQHVPEPVKEPVACGTLPCCGCQVPALRGDVCNTFPPYAHAFSAIASIPLVCSALIDCCLAARERSAASGECCLLGT